MKIKNNLQMKKTVLKQIPNKKEEKVKKYSISETRAK
jgi:hypothetical protein